jgi:hypothetical protein
MLSTAKIRFPTSERAGKPKLSSTQRRANSLSAVNKREITCGPQS